MPGVAAGVSRVTVITGVSPRPGIRKQRHIVITSQERRIYTNSSRGKGEGQEFRGNFHPDKQKKKPGGGGLTPNPPGSATERLSFTFLIIRLVTVCVKQGTLKKHPVDKPICLGYCMDNRVVNRCGTIRPFPHRPTSRDTSTMTTRSPFRSLPVQTAPRYSL